MVERILEASDTEKVLISSKSSNGTVQNREVLAVTEQGLYKILWRSNKPKAQRHIIKQQNDMIGIMAPKAIAFDDETSTDGWYSGSAAAKLIYGRVFKDGRNKLYKFLREKGVLLRVGRHNMPTGYYMDKGWLKAVWTYDARMKKDVPTPVFSKKGIREIHWMIIGKEMETYKEDLFF